MDDNYAFNKNKFKEFKFYLEYLNNNLINNKIGWVDFNYEKFPKMWSDENVLSTMEKQIKCNSILNFSKDNTSVDSKVNYYLVRDMMKMKMCCLFTIIYTIEI